MIASTVVLHELEDESTSLYEAVFGARNHLDKWEGKMIEQLFPPFAYEDQA